MVIVGGCKFVFPAIKNYPLNLCQLQIPYYSPELEKWKTINDGRGYGTDLYVCCHAFPFLAGIVKRKYIEGYQILPSAICGPA
jgi:hypothetical protein